VKKQKVSSVVLPQTKQVTPLQYTIRFYCVLKFMGYSEAKKYLETLWKNLYLSSYYGIIGVLY